MMAYFFTRRLGTRAGSKVTRLTRLKSDASVFGSDSYVQLSSALETRLCWAHQLQFYFTCVPCRLWAWLGLWPCVHLGFVETFVLNRVVSLGRPNDASFWQAPLWLYHCPSS